MNLVRISFHIEFSEAIERILDRAGVKTYVRYPQVHGKDRDGKREESKVFPGAMTVYEVEVSEDALDGLFEKLKEFKDRREAHAHLRAVVLAVEKRLE